MIAISDTDASNFVFCTGATNSLVHAALVYCVVQVPRLPPANPLSFAMYYFTFASYSQHKIATSSTNFIILATQLFQQSSSTLILVAGILFELLIEQNTRYIGSHVVPVAVDFLLFVLIKIDGGNC